MSKPVDDILVGHDPEVMDMLRKWGIDPDHIATVAIYFRPHEMATVTVTKILYNSQRKILEEWMEEYQVVKR